MKSLAEHRDLGWEDLVTDVTLNPGLEFKVLDYETAKMYFGWEKVMHIYGDERGHEEDVFDFTIRIMY